MGKKKVAAELEYRNSMPASSYQQQKLRVCEICSAYLGIHDNDRRLADHFGGKLHLGFIQIREKLAELQATMDIRRPLKREAKMLEISTGGEREGTERKGREEAGIEIEREAGVDTRRGKGAEVGVEDTEDTRGAEVAVEDTVTDDTREAGVEEKDGEGHGPFRKISRRSGLKGRAEI